MAVSIQKAEWRPITFVLHDTTVGAAPVVVPLVIRPEDLTRSDTSRLTTVQTLGGAWADNFGAGIPTVQISGHTGWGSGGRPNGLVAFQSLHARVFTQWHLARAAAVANGQDPNGVRLIFSDGLDNFTWVCAPQNFVLKRNRSRPLLAQYQISLVWLADVASDPASSLGGFLDGVLGGVLGNFLGSVSGVVAKQRGLGSLIGAIGQLQSALDLRASDPLGALGDTFSGFTSMTRQVLSGAADAISGSGDSAVVPVAGDMARAGAQATAMVLGQTELSEVDRGEIMRVGSAFDQSATLLEVALKPEITIPDFSGLYGDALTGPSSTNLLPQYLDQPSKITVSPDAAAAIHNLKGADPVLAPLSLDALALNMAAAAGGVKLNA